MVRLIPELPGDKVSSMSLAIGLFVSVSALVALCAKHVRRAPKNHDHGKTTSNGDQQYSINMVPKSLLASSKQLVSSLSNKAIPFIYKKKGGDEQADHEVEDGFGEGGLWQRAILMGDKCRPPEFSGVIYYDNYGNQLSEMPLRSPRASPLPAYSIPVARDGN
ncbi:uncharacterized protein LOC107429567 [Ziziphus jujuba]|uniref:Uncharacterized protein LOC107429567 n=1 Tax=Ziziphus jujuba TaxID=326968 RepID=A0A6P4B1R4_ZIZJJ|nr:uncharacterized protein LOC107429567 [Ziziphus jujuba]